MGGGNHACAHVCHVGLVPKDPPTCACLRIQKCSLTVAKIIIKGQLLFLWNPQNLASDNFALCFRGLSFLTGVDTFCMYRV